MICTQIMIYFAMPNQYYKYYEKKKNNNKSNKKRRLVGVKGLKYKVKKKVKRKIKDSSMLIINERDCEEE